MEPERSWRGGGDNTVYVLDLLVSISLTTYTSPRNEPMWPGSGGELELLAFSLVDHACSGRCGGVGGQGGLLCLTLRFRTVLTHRGPGVSPESGNGFLLFVIYI